MTRREFLDAALAMVAAPAAVSAAGPRAASEVARRKLGSTGVEVSCIGLGGYHIGMQRLDAAESVRIIRRALDSGLTFLDNCWDYNGGRTAAPTGRGPPRRTPHTPST